MTVSLQGKIFSGAGWIVGWRMATRGLGLISTLVLARLLLPADFGLVALATGFAGAVESMSYMGVEDALVREKSPGRGLYDTGFTLGLLHLNRLKDLIATLRGRYDKIVFDSPPIIGVSDASVLASAVDGAVLLIQHRRNPQSMVIRAQQIVEGLKTPLLGVVLNQVPHNSGEDYGYYTNNYSYYHEGGGQRRRRSSAKGAPKSPDYAGDKLDLG